MTDHGSTALGKEGEWVSKVQCSEAGTTSELWVEALAGNGRVGSDIGNESSLAGVANVDACADGWGERESGGVASELCAQVDGGIDDVVVADLNVGLDVGSELASGWVDVDADLG